MRVRILILSAAISLCGCSKKAAIVKEGRGARINDAQFKVEHLVEVPWKVGRSLRDLVTRNLTVVLSLPIIGDDDEEFLRNTYGVDAWLVRIIQSNATASHMELGTLRVPFRGENKGRAGSLPVKSLSFALTYAAAAISERFRSFNCPAFSHDRRLDDYEIQGEQKPMDIAIVASGTYTDRLLKSELVPMTFNIGNSMVGRYAFEVALFNSSEKRLYSGFRPLPFEVKVLTEKTITVEGCAGVHQELDPPAPRSVPSFGR